MITIRHPYVNINTKGLIEKTILLKKYVKYYKMIKIYLAGPFFNEKERNYIEIAANILRNQGYEVIVPMEHFIENGEKLTNEEWALNMM